MPPRLADGRAVRYPMGRMRPLRAARPSPSAAALAWLVWLALTPVAWAQPPPPSAEAAPAASPPLEAIASEDVVERVAGSQRTLRSLEARSEATPEIDAVAQRLEEVGPLWREEADSALQRLAVEASSSLLSETERVWSFRESVVAGWNASLRKRASALSDDLLQLERQRELWERTRDAKRDEQLPDALRDSIRQVLDAVEATRRRLRERRDAVLTVQSRVLEQERRVASVLEAVDAARRQARSRLFVRDSPPLWNALAQAQPALAGQRVRSTWKDSIAPLRGYTREHVGDLAVIAFCLIVFVVVIERLGRRAARRAEQEEGAAATARVLARPVSASLLVLLVAYPLILPAAPLLLRWVLSIVPLIPALRLIAPLLEGAARRAVYLLSGWYAVAAVRELLTPVPLLARIVLLLEAVAALAVLVWLLRPRQLAELAAWSRRANGLAVATRIALLLIAVSLLSNLVGNVSLAEVLLEGTLLGAYLAVLLQGSALVLEGLWAVLLHMRPLGLLGGVQRHEPLLLRRGTTLVRWGLASLWLWFTLGFFQLRESVWNGFTAVLAATWPIGASELSLGDLVAFVLTIWLALWLSRFVRFALDEDVLPRAQLPRGVPYAISSFTHYLILLLGFLLAVSAAGVDMSRFALIVGALGVGIGIGLQDVVNNFVSGVILLFERPVQTGDTVQVGELFGEVRRIGMRSSTVRTWSGAEVIVPNSKLVSDNVVNWTLSDNLRRIEIPIGVAYGTDPERVLALLTDVARAHPSVLAEPLPSAVFLAHGNSSLDFELRAWSASADWYTVRSDLTVAINRALREAGIAIPFPQRDLHLRSVDPEVREALRDPPTEAIERKRT